MRLVVHLNDRFGEVGQHHTILTSRTLTDEELARFTPDKENFMDFLTSMIGEGDGYLTIERDVPGDLITAAHQATTIIPVRRILFVDVVPDDASL